MSQFRKATKLRAKLRAALIGPAGSGKTWTSLALATEMARLMREAGTGKGRIAVIDTECGSAELYANRFDFDVMPLERHSPLDYVKAIEAMEYEGYDFGILDSLSHAWIGKDGALAQVDSVQERDARENRFTAWRHVTPKHNALVEKMLSCKLHLIATIRAKTEYAMDKDEKGKTKIVKLGMGAIQRDGLEYEFGLVGDLDQTNTLKVSKTRLDGVVSMNEIIERPGAELARKIWTWLQDGAEVRPAAPAPITSPVTELEMQKHANGSSPVTAALDEVFARFIEGLRAASSLRDLVIAAGTPGKPEKGTPNHKIATDVYLACHAELTRKAKEAKAS